jgi:hypothetical protein
MLHPLPFTTFGELAGLGFKATVYCSLLRASPD